MRRSFMQLQLARTGSVLSGVLAATLWLETVSIGQSQIITLSDRGSVVSIDPGSQAGLYYWNILAQGSPAQQWFWYRIGTNHEASIDTISAPTITLYGTREATISYQNELFKLDVDFLLTGGPVIGPPSGNVDLGLAVRVSNLSSNGLDFHFFQYTDFVLPYGAGGGDTLQLGRNLRGFFNDAFQQTDSAGLSTTTTPGANHGEAAFFNQTLLKLNDGNADILNDNAGPVGPGNTTWALQWDWTISTNGSVLMSEDTYSEVFGPPPVLAPIPDRSTTVGSLVTFTNHATGLYPPFDFWLAFGAPTGASVNATNGVFTWRPTAAQAGTTNPIGVVVRDGDMPAGWTTQRFTVIVADYIQLALDQTVIGTGEGGSLALTLLSSAALTNLSCTLELLPNRLTNLSLIPLAPQIGSASFIPTSPTDWQLNLQTVAGTFLQGSQQLARLDIIANSNRPSAFVGITLSDLVAPKTGGTSETSSNLQSGRVVVVGNEPLLEAQGCPVPSVTLYGNIGAGYVIELATNLMSGANWQEVTRGIFYNRSVVVLPSPTAPPVSFYRAYELY